MSDQRIFITGGASGLGRAIALRFAQAGWKVCIADIHDDRGAETREALAALGVETFYLRCDVRREEDLRAAAEALGTRWGGVDVVVNNAGVAQAGAIEDVSLDDWQWILDINLLGVVRGCKVFTPVFKRQGHGCFVNIASMAGLLDLPEMSSYNVSKAGVVALSETLQQELTPSNIAVTVVCPSFFKTNLGESMRATDPRLSARLARLLEKSPITAEDIANDIFRAVDRREFLVLPHEAGRKAWLLKRFLPRTLYTRVVHRGARRKRPSAGATPS